MHNLKPSNKDAFTIYKDAVSRKREGDEKTLLTNNEALVGYCYNEYDDGFAARDVNGIIPHKITAELKKALFDMYEYSNKAVRDIRADINKNNPPNVAGFCQNCGLTHANTMDHYLPHEKFPEYSIHAKNLIPCCSECNEKKGEAEILNMYLDILPDKEYLFMDVERSDDTLSFTFRLENKGGEVNADLFNRIDYHYNKLNLFSRMKEAAIQALPRFELDIKPYYKASGKDTIIDTDKETIEDMRKAYGYNYWEVAFRKGLIESDVFWAYYKERIDGDLI